MFEGITGIFETPGDMIVESCTSGAGRIVYTYEGDRVAGAQGQSTTDK